MISKYTKYKSYMNELQDKTEVYKISCSCTKCYIEQKKETFPPS